MSGPEATSGPTELQLALFAALEDIHDLTQAITVILVDDEGAPVAVSGDEGEFPLPLRNALGARKLAEAGSVRALLEDVELGNTPLNVTILPVGAAHVLAILFDAQADFATVDQVGREARDMLEELLGAVN